MADLHLLVTRPDVPGADDVRRAAVDLGARLTWLPTASGRLEPPPASLRVALHDVDGVLAQGADPLDAAAFDGAPRLRVAALAAVGTDQVDLAAARRHGVRVCNTPGVLAETTADTAFSLVLMARRGLVQATDTMRAGGWTGFSPTAFLGHDVAGATLGVVGYGEIGRAVARRARGFGMTVRHLHRGSAPADGVSSPVGWEELLGGSDVLVLAVPLTGQTRGMVDAAALALMRPSATLVNIGRGPLVVQADLLDALRTGRLHSAGLDVFDGEPRADKDDPVMSTPGLVVLPHVGSASHATRRAMTRLALRNLVAVLSGEEPPTPVV